MRAIVPTQITTVEDKLFGSFTIRQFMLLAAPIALFILTLVFLPPRTGIVAYKVVICGIAAVVMMPMAIKIKGKLLVDWFGIAARYMTRPRYYVYDKNTSYLRSMPEETQATVVKQDKAVGVRNLLIAKKLPQKERLRLQSLIDQGLSVNVEVGKKGKLHVIVAEKE
jgi:hypothetical protein